jgi:hypothetical protein
MSDHKRLTVDEAIRAMLDGGTLTSYSKGEFTFDPSYTFPFRFRIRKYSGELADTTHPQRCFRDGELWIKDGDDDDPGDWMERPEYARAKLWMERCEAERVYNAQLQFRLERAVKALETMAQTGPAPDERNKEGKA